MRYLFILIVGISFAHFWQLEHEIVFSGTIGDAEILNVAGENLIVARLAENTEIKTPDGSTITYPIDRDFWAYYVACDDSLVCFMYDYTDSASGIVNIVSQKLYPEIGGIQRSLIPFMCKEWYPVWSSSLGRIVIIATEDVSEGIPGSDFFIEQRGVHFLDFPGMNSIISYSPVPVPHRPFDYSDYLLIPMEQEYSNSIEFGEDSDSSWSYDNYYCWYFDTESFDTLKTVFLGRKGSFEINIESDTPGGSFDHNIYSLVYGKSSRDFDGDGYIDLPIFETHYHSWREPFGSEMILNSTRLKAGRLIIDSTRLGSSFSYLLLGNLIPGEDYCLATGNNYFYGRELADFDTFTIALEIANSMKDIFDYDNDSLEEIYGWRGDTLQIYEIGTDYSITKINRGWNMIAPALNSPGTRFSDIAPYAVDPVYYFNTETRAYEPADTILSGVGYYLLSPYDTVLEWIGDEIDSVHYKLEPGWNMVGGYSEWLHKSILFDIPEILLTPYYFVISTYFEDDYLIPGRGYMIFSTASIDTIIVND